MFLHYLSWRLRQIDSVACVIKERLNLNFVNFANEQVLKKAELPPNASLGQWVLFDSTKNGPPTTVWPSVLVTSPEYVTVGASPPLLIALPL